MEWFFFLLWCRLKWLSAIYSWNRDRIVLLCILYDTLCTLKTSLAGGFPKSVVWMNAQVSIGCEVKDPLLLSPKKSNLPPIQDAWPSPFSDLPPNNFLTVPKNEREVFDLWKLMSACWKSHFNVPDTFKCASLRCVCVWEPLTCQISPPHSVSALSWFLTGDDSDYAYAPAATSAANTLPHILLRRGSGQPLWKPTNPSIHLPKLWQGSRAERGDEVEKANGRTGHMNRGGS